MINDLELYKVMLELAEDENIELKEENQRLRTLVGALKGWNTFLENKNKELVLEYDNLTAIEKRLN